MPNESWQKWIEIAYKERIGLSATGFYSTPNIGYDWNTNQGNPFAYFTYGVAATVVEIDCLTGDHVVLKTDIVMDIGESINPAIDIGQIEGAFAQGYGLFMLEQMVHSPDGNLWTKGKLELIDVNLLDNFNKKNFITFLILFERSWSIQNSKFW